jgi:hypothetical protein
MFHPVTARRRFAAIVLSSAAGVAGTATAGSVTAVQEVHSPGPAVRMSANGSVAGFYVAKCTTLSSQPKRTLCYNAPWVYDGRQLSKLAGKFPSNANAKAVAVNDSGDLIGADLTGAWFMSRGVVAYVDGANPSIANSRLLALDNRGVALGVSSFAGTYQAMTYAFNGTPVAVLPAGYTPVDRNEAGWIVGWFRNAANLEQAFLADPRGNVGAITSLDPAINCRPVRISQAGTGDPWVAGNCAGNRPYRYKWGTPGPVELRYANSSNLGVVSINSRGDAVGSAVRPGQFAPDGYTAVLWKAGATGDPEDLNAGQKFAPVGAWNVHATDINDSGTVLTGYNDTTGNFYTFLLSTQ